LKAAGRRRQGGYVLVMVLGALALVALVAGRFAQRIDELRAQATTLDGQARARIEAASALAGALYWITTRPSNAAGWGEDPTQQVHADGRPYTLPGGAELRVQDTRGLLPLNALRRQHLLRLLTDAEVPPPRADAMVDVLLDYIDRDNLKRLNGAERDEYAALGLPPPSNDWLFSVRELSRMPLWRDDPALLARLEPLLSTNREGLFNPNAAAAPVLRALMPQARPEQIELFETLRRDNGFFSGEAAQRATGLPLRSDTFFFHASEWPRITVSAPGLIRPLQYNLYLTPDGVNLPWAILEARSAPRSGDKPAPPRSEQAPAASPSTQPQTEERATAFPLVLAIDRP